MTTTKMRMRFILLAVLILGLVQIQAQLTTGTVVGTVTDASGAVIPGAKVSITNLGTKVVNSATTTGTGDYTFNLLIPGQYTVTVEANGFKKIEIAAFPLAGGDRLRENASLQPGSVEQTVQVSSSAPLLQTDSSTVQSTVTENSVQDLPLNGRNFVNLVQVQPGVNQGQANGIASGTRPDDRRESDMMSANGQSDTFNDQLLDGLDDNERILGTIAVRPSIDAIGEVQVETNNFDAEIGRVGGAVVNIITKSGTNNLHGSAYEFVRNDLFDARDWFAKAGLVTKPEWRQNQFGGSIGGPIMKDRTFFFADVEDDRIVQGTSSGDITVPTCYEEEHPGDFTDIGGPFRAPNTLDPVGLAYFKMFPKPNISCTAPTANYIHIGKQPQTTLSLDGRIDQHFGNGDTLFGRYSYNNVSTFVPPAFPDVTVNGTTIHPGGNMFAWPGQSTTKAHGFQLSYDHPFSQNLIMVLKAGYTRVDIATLNLNHGTDASSAIGLINANTPAAPETSGLMPLFFLQGGYAFLGDTIAIPILDVNDNYLYAASLLYTHGSHNFKFGAQITRRQLNYFNQNYPMGLAYFSGLTGNSLEDLLTGLPLGWARTDTLYKHYDRSWELGWYGEDNWRVNSKLTLNLGLRYDIFTPLSDIYGRQANFIYPTQKLLLGSEDPDTGIRTNHLNWSPRIGFSYSALSKTVLRGGFGISYYPLEALSYALSLNPPYIYQANCLPCLNFGAQGPTSKFWPTLPIPTLGSTTNLAGQYQWQTSDFNSGQVQGFNLMLQQEFGANVLTVGGVGELGRHVTYTGTANLPLPTGPYPNNQKTGPGQTPSYTTVATLPNVQQVSLISARGTQNYYALQVIFARRFTKGLEFNANYTWAHDLTDGFVGTGFGQVSGLVANNPHYDYGNAGADLRDRFASTVTYQLPFGNNAQGWTKRFIGGWTSNMIMFWQTGQGFTVSDGATNSNGVAQINLPSITSDRPDYIGGQAYRTGSSGLDGSSYINPSAFTPQVAGTPGSEHNVQNVGPHIRRADLSLFKNFSMPENATLQFRAEVFNLSNTPNFAIPNSTISVWKEGSQHDFNHPIKAGDPGFCSAGSGNCVAVGLLPGDVPQTGSHGANFGAITSTATNINPRQFQFALKLLF